MPVQYMRPPGCGRADKDQSHWGVSLQRPLSRSSKESETVIGCCILAQWNRAKDVFSPGGRLPGCEFGHCSWYGELLTHFGKRPAVQSFPVRPFQGVLGT